MVGVGVDDAVDGLGSEASVGDYGGVDVGGMGAGNFGMDLSQTGPADAAYGGHETVAQAVAANVDDPDIGLAFARENISYGPKSSFLGMEVQPYTDLTDQDLALIEEYEYGFPLSEVDASAGGDTPQDNRWDFINPPVVQPPVQPVAPVAPTISYEDSVLFNFTPRERRNYLLNQINMGMDPTRGYTGPDGVYVDLTTVYPDIFSAPSDYVTFPDRGIIGWEDDGTTLPKDLEFRLPSHEGFELPPGTRDPKTGRIYSRDTSWLIPPPAGSFNTMWMEPHIHPITGEIAYANSGGWTIDPEIYNQLKTEGAEMRGGGYVDDYRMNRGGIMNIRDEEGRVIGVQDDAADEMNRIRYHSGRDARDERFRVAARERDAREEMDRLRREARYEDVHGRGLRTFGHGGGVGSLAPVARNMFRKRRLPRAGMVM